MHQQEAHASSRRGANAVAFSVLQGQPGTASRDIHLLVIDDQLESLSLLLEYLRDPSIRVWSAENAKEAKRVLREKPIDLALLDVRMPGTDGIMLCAQIKASPDTRHVPVVFLSGADTVDDKLRGFQAGAVDYITKPFNAREVLARVYMHLGERARLLSLEMLTTARNDFARQGIQQEDAEAALFRRAVALLRQPGSQPSIQKLSEHMGLPQRRLHEVFRARVGMTAGAYARQLRLERARSLLADGRMQVQLIADALGYSNAGDFIRAFRKHYGVTPRRYREQLRQR
jgi:DNA-binding response OmpR family regulator